MADISATTDDPTNDGKGPAQTRFEQLCPDREIYLTRAREASKLTLPTLIPLAGHTSSSTYDTPYQSIGARGVNNLSSKLLLTLLPPNAPFFRMVYSDVKFEKQAQVDPKFKAMLEETLSSYEINVATFIETGNARVTSHEGFKHLLVAGNVLLFVRKDAGMRMFSLDRYVVKRDPEGNVLEGVVKESVAPMVLPKEIQDAISKSNEEKKNNAVERTVDCYTHIQLDASGKNFTVYQEVKGIRLPKSDGSYPIDKMPWLFLRYTTIDGEDYGRGFVEEYIGDLKSLESLCKSVVEGAAICAKMTPVVNPNGMVRVSDLTGKANGEPIVGGPDDVKFLQVDKQPDLQVAANTAKEIEQRLSFAFLLQTSIQRNGERVTAEEIRYMAGELEDSLGGVYSVLSQEFQLRFVNCILAQMERQGKLPKLPKEIVKPAIITGLEALGRGHDLNKLSLFIQGAGQEVGPQAVASYINLDEYFRRRATAIGIDSKGLIKTPEEIAQMQQQAQAQNAISQLGPHAINAFGKVAAEKQKQQGQPQDQQAQQPEGVKQ